jgi:hypothetical protein
MKIRAAALHHCARALGQLERLDGDRGRHNGISWQSALNPARLSLT